jgi:hypothetical protein
MKRLFLAASCIALLSACNGGSGSIGSAGSAQSVGSGGSSSGSGSFGGRRDAEEQQAVALKPKDTRAFVPVLKSAKLDKTKGGLILRVEGQMERVGYYNLELVLIEDGSASVITYEARAAAPRIGKSATTERSRDVDLATFIKDKYVPSARTIVVQGLNNKLSIRR